MLARWKFSNREIIVGAIYSSRLPHWTLIYRFISALTHIKLWYLTTRSSEFDIK
jgi:hypothetical protein